FSWDVLHTYADHDGLMPQRSMRRLYTMGSLESRERQPFPHSTRWHCQLNRACRLGFDTRAGSVANLLGSRFLVSSVSEIEREATRAKERSRSASRGPTLCELSS